VAHLRPDVEVLDSAGYDWNADPYSRGTWCVTKPLQLTRYAEHLALPEGEFFFAGSDIAAGWAGYIDGAIETGIRSAREVIRFLGHA
jgi:monoamine oxidase